MELLKSLLFLLSIVYNGLVIQGGSRGTNLLVSFGMKFDIMFKKVSVKCYNLPVGISVDVKVLTPWETDHDPFNSS